MRRLPRRRVGPEQESGHEQEWDWVTKLRSGSVCAGAFVSSCLLPLVFPLFSKEAEPPLPAVAIVAAPRPPTSKLC